MRSLGDASSTLVKCCVLHCGAVLVQCIACSSMPPSTPPSAILHLQMASQLQPAPLAVAGMRVHASQLHAPNVCFIGDAAHGVSTAQQWLATALSVLAVLGLHANVATDVCSGLAAAKGGANR